MAVKLLLILLLMMMMRLVKSAVDVEIPELVQFGGL
jgi:hypothetical protein